jgi:hypothetical protein
MPISALMLTQSVMAAVAAGAIPALPILIPEPMQTRPETAVAVGVVAVETRVSLIPIPAPTLIRSETGVEAAVAEGGIPALLIRTPEIMPIP